MINQHLQTATLPGGVPTPIAELQDFIAAFRDAREARKALAVKLVVPRLLVRRNSSYY